MQLQAVLATFAAKLCSVASNAGVVLEAATATAAVPVACRLYSLTIVVVVVVTVETAVLVAVVDAVTGKRDVQNARAAAFVDSGSKTR
jgi:hypothetical protein